MKNIVKKIADNVVLYRDSNNGIAWIEDGRTGLGISVHPNIDATGSVRGMKSRGYWGKNDRTVRSHGWIYNIDKLVYDENNELEKIVYDSCVCVACRERREALKPEKKPLTLETALALISLHDPSYYKWVMGHGESTTDLSIISYAEYLRSSDEEKLLCEEGEK